MLEINRKNIGAIICMKENGRLFRVDDVDETYVSLRNEVGEISSSYEHQVDGHWVEDAVRCATFNRNCQLGDTLNAAYFAAMKHLMDPDFSEEERLDAIEAMDMITEQRKHLFEQVYGRELTKNGSSHDQKSSVTNLIDEADKEKGVILGDASFTVSKNKGCQINVGRE